jgi:hypothetical protein
MLISSLAFLYVRSTTPRAWYFEMARLTTRGHTQPSSRQRCGQDICPDGSDEIGGRFIDAITGEDELVFSGPDRDGEIAPVGTEAGNIGGITDRGAKELVRDQQWVDHLLDTQYGPDP